MDNIDQLQTDDSDVSDKDKYVINTIFTNQIRPKTYHIQQITMASLFFCILSLPKVDELIEKMLKVNNQYYKLMIKELLFFSFYFLIINYIVKNKW